MNANAYVLRKSGPMGAPAEEAWSPPSEVLYNSKEWNPETFAREQIRSLVRRVFFAGGAKPVKQVVFCAAGHHTDVACICDQVGQALALETSADIAVVIRQPGPGRMWGTSRPGGGTIKSWSARTAINLWRVPESGVREVGEESGTGRYWLSRLAELRNEFEYSIIQGREAGISSEAALLGRLADGVILVIEARTTRKATARKIKESLEGARSRILGSVLSERTFPIPARLYRRL